MYEHFYNVLRICPRSLWINTSEVRGIISVASHDNYTYQPLTGGSKVFESMFGRRKGGGVNRQREATKGGGVEGQADERTGGRTEGWAEGWIIGADKGKG